jgi:hypothetical protein
MKKFWKIFLSIILVLALTGGGTLYYFLKVKTYDVADEEVEEITQSEYEILLPGEKEPVTISNGGKKVVGTKDKSNSTSAEDNSNDDVSASNGSNSNPSSNDTSSNDSSKNNQSSGASDQSSSKELEVTVASIKNLYRPTFESLESQANQKIDSLVSKAFNEYQTKKQNGESISFAYFYQKYSSAGSQLESQTDGAFHYIYKALEKELKNNGFSPSHAVSFKEEYEKAKNARESALLNKAKGAL